MIAALLFAIWVAGFMVWPLFMVPDPVASPAARIAARVLWPVVALVAGATAVIGWSQR